MKANAASPLWQLKSRGSPLTDQQELVLRLCELDKLTHTEVALRLGVSKKRIQQIYRTAKAIREDYAQNGRDALLLLPGRVRHFLEDLDLASRPRVKLAMVTKELFWNEKWRYLNYQGNSPRNTGRECWLALLEWAADD